MSLHADALRAPTGDPFAAGIHGVGVKTVALADAARQCVFPCDIWYPAAAQSNGGAAGRELRDAAPAAGPHPAIVFSHPSASHRRAATYLCTHLASHGYVVAALDHSEVVAPRLARREGESAAERQVRIDGIVASRVPDIRFLVDELIRPGDSTLGIAIDAARIGIAGHSFGGWTALAAAKEDARIAAVVALAPGGASERKPGILPLELSFDAWHGAPVLLVAAEDDESLPIAGMHEIFQRMPPPKRMVTLRRADHCHFMDDAERIHEELRKDKWPPELAWLNAMRPIAELLREGDAHFAIRGLAVCHFDAVLRRDERAASLLARDLPARLAAHGVEVLVRDA